MACTRPAFPCPILLFRVSLLCVADQCLDDYLDKPPSDYLICNLVPVITMAACLPTLKLFLMRGDYINFALYGMGFVVAVVYHLLQLTAHGGLHSVGFLGLSGAGWRTFDILSANMLLARTLGHALNVDRSLVAAVPNVLLPTCILTVLTSYEGATLSLCSRLTAAAMLSTLGLQLALDGRLLLQFLSAQYRDRQMACSLLAMALGLVVFALPSHPSHSHMYWLWHSAWHVAMGWGYYYLYLGLLDRYWPAWHKVRSLAGSSAPIKAVLKATNQPHSALAQDLYGMQACSPAGSQAGSQPVGALEREDSVKSTEVITSGLELPAGKASRSASPVAVNMPGVVTRARAKAAKSSKGFAADISVRAGGPFVSEFAWKGDSTSAVARRRSARRL